MASMECNLDTLARRMDKDEVMPAMCARKLGR